MRLVVERILAKQRGLYDLPRDRNRFNAYLRMLSGGTDDMVLPISAMNPMGKDRAPASFDRLISMKVEEHADVWLRDVERRLVGVQGELKVVFTVGDDVQGSWTHKTLGRAKERSDLRAAYRRGWCIVTFYTSEEPSLDDVRAETLMQVYRTAYQMRRGPPKTVEDWMHQEGRALRFAGSALAIPDEATRERLRPFMPSTSFGVAYAILFGDERAREAGYDALGFRPGDGDALALSVARSDPTPPEAFLQ